jgi:hypothetical protein
MLRIRLLSDSTLAFAGMPVTTVNMARLKLLLAHLGLHCDAP